MTPSVFTIDAGVTSGYCLLDVTDAAVQLRLTGSVQPEGVEDLRLHCPTDAIVVIEEPLVGIGRGQLARELTDVMKVLTRTFPSAQRVYASDWKSTRWAKASVPSECRTSHQKDAYHIGLWFIANRL